MRHVLRTPGLAQRGLVHVQRRDPRWHHGRVVAPGVGDGDLGRVIGRRGRTAASIRTVTRAAASKDDVEIDIEFLDD